MSIKKRYFKNKKTCKVNFRLPKGVFDNATDINLVGEFNKWDVQANPLKKLKNGSFTTELELEKGKEYQFRYLINKSRWENDKNADKYIPTPYEDARNSVIIV